MARFIPDVRPEQIEHDSERLVYEALQRLPGNFLVLHSFPWLRPDRAMAGSPLREGEADFIILHRQLGMLVLEVKGGTPRLDGRTWFRGSRPMRDPFEQARRNMHALVDAVEERARGRLSRDQFVFGYAVVFPHTAYGGRLPANTDRSIFFDSRDLGRLPVHVEDALRAWTKAPRPLSKDQFRVLTDALMPKLRVLRCVGPEMDRAEAQLVRLTENQQTTLRGLFGNRRVLVEGVAGSGKTLLALELAVSLAEQGRRVQLLCYNRQLADWLEERLVAEPRLETAEGSLAVSTFHSLALTLADRAGVEVESPSRRGQAFWEREAAGILDHAIGELRGTDDDPTVDALVIDEAQDFAEEWWLALEELLDEPHAGTLFAFADLSQRLREGGGAPPIEFPTKFRLTTNCRNTRRIAAPSAIVADAQVDLLPSAPLGARVKLIRATSRSQQAAHVRREVAALLGEGGLTPARVALIGPAGKENGALSSERPIAGAELITDAAAWRRGEGLLCTTAKAFKGLEADAVIVYDLDSIGGLFTERDLYVAWTRAKHLLILICHGDPTRALIEAALARAEEAE